LQLHRFSRDDVVGTKYCGGAAKVSSTGSPFNPNSLDELPPTDASHLTIELQNEQMRLGMILT
jgi:hypothetical protein